MDKNLIKFRGGDMEAICKEATARGLAFDEAPKIPSDGSANATIVGSDGIAIVFNTFSDEREEYVRNGTLSD